LAADRSLDDSSITVRSVRKGVVRLGGTATSADDVIRALVSATNRPGVRGVFSEIEGRDAFVAPSQAREVGIPPPVAIPVRLVGVEGEDDVIRRGVERALNDLDPRDNADIDVSVTNGVVRLSGIVPTWEGNESRIHATRSVTGVRSIINSLRVVELSASRR
jgi:osmotically-inducible protein OsmY